MSTSTQPPPQLLLHRYFVRCHRRVKNDWSKRLSLRGMRRGAARWPVMPEPPKHKHKFFNRSSSLKHATSASKVTLELQTPSQTQSPHQQLSQQNSVATPKKSNWEVIEHFNTSSTKGGKAVVSSSLIAAGITRCNIDESIDSTNSSSTCPSPWCTNVMKHLLHK
ncbi:unnamed protein product, partial [Ceratitis capitata]